MKKYFWIAAAVLICSTIGTGLVFADENQQQAVQISELPPEEETSEETGSPESAETTETVEGAGNTEQTAAAANTENTKKAENTEEMRPESEDMAKALAKSYYRALMAGDAETMEIMLDAAADKSKIPEDVKRYTSAAESLENLACYPLEGMREGEYFVFVRYEMKFPGIQTTAPGLETVYVRPDAEGNLRLLTCRDFDQELLNKTADAVGSSGIHILAGRIEEGFENARQSDSALNAYVNALLREKEAQMTGRTGRRVSGKADAADPEKTENGAASGESTAENEGRTAYTTTRVKFRRRPVADSSQDYYVLDAGVRVEILQSAGTNGEWREVRLEDGRTGYIFGEYLRE